MESLTEELCAELGRLPQRTSRTSFLAQNRDLLNASLVRELGEAVRSAVRSDVRKAFELAQGALAIARELRDIEALATGLRAKANALWFQGDCRAAVRLFRRAAQLFERCGNESELARTLSSSIQSLALLGEYRQAVDAAERAREIFLRLGDSWRLARVDINLANVYHRQNHYREALSAYERAYQQLLPYRDMEAIGVALHNMAVCLIALDSFEEAFPTYQRARDLFAREDMPLLVAQADYNVASLHYLRGDYTAALQLLRSTRETYSKNGDDYHVSLCDLDQSEIYLELSLVDEAAEMARRSLDHFEKLGMNYEQARSLVNLAIALHLAGDSAQALAVFGRAREISAQEENPVLPRIIDLYRALVLLELGDAASALEISTSTAEFFASIPIPSKYVLSKLILTRACLRLGRIEDAETHCQEALRSAEHLDAPILFYQAHFLRGQILEAETKNEEAYAAYQQARSAVESLRSSLQRQELKIGFMRNRLDVYSRLTVLCLARGGEDHAFEEALSYIEAAKSRTLRDVILAGTQIEDKSAQTSATEARVRELRRELNWYYHRIEREQLSRERTAIWQEDALNREAHAREHELSRILLEMPEALSVGAALRDSTAAGLNQIREKLGDDASLLEYFALDGQIHVAVITAGSLQVIPLAQLPGVTQSVRMLQFQLAKFQLDPAYTTRFHDQLLRSTQHHLRNLYDALVAPVAHLLNGRDLVIVPFGALHSLPFHALFDGEQYLIDRFDICYEPSASIFHHCHREMPPVNGPSLVLGIEDEKLRFIKEEVDAVAGVVPDARVLYGDRATESELRRYGRSSRIIHIASHGIFRQDNPLFSSIRLSGSYLTLYDLYHMDLPVDLLTLSGCVTGLNVVAEGDELLGLTRGLLYAGARSLLLSLWEVDDRSTSEFMHEFYCSMAKGSRKSDALRSAMLALRQHYPHPYYWAPFKLTGRALTAAES
ncbi:MAG TPA: CHAT domain-containing protein [Bryobacteraceae bacterium]|jgi:CHAT domain-containing protein|nr:CHAT domain-containing protein [Bryobacteraceae bacterium]